jgi:hypothetical protein
MLVDISPEEVTRRIEEVRLAISKKSPPYAVVLGAFSTPPGADVSVKVRECALRICERIRKSVVLCEPLVEFGELREKDKATLQPFRYEMLSGKEGSG